MKWFVTVDGRKLVTMHVDAETEEEAVAKAKEVWSDDSATYRAMPMTGIKTLFGG